MNGVIYETASVYGALTPQLLVLLDLLALGFSTPRIAHICEMTPGTVRNKLGRIYRILGVTNRTQAAVWWHIHHDAIVSAYELESEPVGLA